MKRSRCRSSSLTRTEDISRLMDPSYLPHSSSSASSSPVSVHAWVDDHGDLHDPDYRDFPILAATTARRPHWESSNSTYEVAPSSTSSHRPVSPRERRKARYDAEYALYATSAPSYGSGSTSTSHAYDEVDAPLPPSPRRRKLRALSPRRSSDSTPEALDIERFWLEEDAETVEQPKEEYIPSRHQADLTPSCSDQIRRQWQTFALSVRFSLFRAQRRLHRRLSAT